MFSGFFYILLFSVFLFYIVRVLYGGLSFTGRTDFKSYWRERECGISYPLIYQTSFRIKKSGTG